MNHFATSDFWYCNRRLPDELYGLTDEEIRLVEEATTR